MQCALEGCVRRAMKRAGLRGPIPKYCSVKHRNRAFSVRYHYGQYGITQGIYNEMLEAQDGRCAICGSENNLAPGRGAEGSFHIDHDHVTGKVRGLLCSLCNRMLGQARDNPEILRSGAAYLEEEQ